MRHPPRSRLLRVSAHAPSGAGAPGAHTRARSVFSASDGTSTSPGTGPRGPLYTPDGSLDG